ncbi:MAG TPA: 2-phosphosulfolactate phosphatase [Lapillicoccus sp.]|nr:2-phosphosulfolactate phosphatase [Lapillicoccus sp.]
MELRLEWGPTGAKALAPECDVAVVVDVLTFSTTVSVAVDEGIQVKPYRWADASASDAALAAGATLAVPRPDAAAGDVSLSPATFRSVGRLSRVLLPSPNGSTICAVLAEAGATVVVGCLRNRQAVARFLAERGGRILLVPAGERWPDDSLRPAVEDLWGAGGIAAALLDGRTPEVAVSDEALAAAAAYAIVESRIGEALAACPSGQELLDIGYASDVAVAAEIESSGAVPVLTDGWLLPG